MAEWIQCPGCQLKHVLRPDGLCPRCRRPVAAAGWESVSSSAPPPPPAVAYPAAQPPAVGYAAVPDAFTVGRFISGVFATWGRNAGWVIPVSLLAYTPAAFAMYRLYSGIWTGRSAGADPTSVLAGIVGAVLLVLLLMPLELGAIARAGVRRLQGEPVDLGDMLGVGVRFYFPALGLLLLVGLAYLGTACTIVVPFILLTGWAASAPAMLTEELGPIEAMKRSWALTRGLRWQVFAGFLVVVLAMTAIACVVQSILSVLVISVVAASGGIPGQAGGSMAGLQAVSMLMQGVESSVLTTATAVAYHQLRVATEGPATARLGSVFA